VMCSRMVEKCDADFLQPPLWVLTDLPAISLLTLTVFIYMSNRRKVTVRVRYITLGTTDLAGLHRRLLEVGLFSEAAFANLALGLISCVPTFYWDSLRSM
jgi:hypothetical protein